LAINEKIIPHIEKALNLKLRDRQVRFLTGENAAFWSAQRREGATTAYCIRLSLSKGDPLDMRKPKDFCDYPHTERYANSYFKNRFLEIRAALEAYGFPVREITKVERR
jgi:hypothetical protein